MPTSIEIFAIRHFVVSGGLIMFRAKFLTSALLITAIFFSVAMPASAALPSASSAATQSASSEIKYYTINNDDITARVKKNVKTGQITYTSFYNISHVERADLQNGAETARQSGGKVFFYFDTLVSDRVTARIIVNPFLVRSAEGGVSLVLDTSAANNKAVIDKFTGIFGRKVAVMRCSQSEDFGFTVVLAGKLDISGMDKNKLIAYSYDAATNKYEKISAANCTVDDQGFVYLESRKGGHIIIVENTAA